MLRVRKLIVLHAIHEDIRMRYAVLVILPLLTGCLTAATGDMQTREDDLQTFRGEIYFQGEFHLFDSGLRPPTTEDRCVSGVFRRDLHERALNDFHGRRVEIVGRLVRYGDLEMGRDTVSIALSKRYWEGMYVANTCSYDWVILGESISMDSGDSAFNPQIGGDRARFPRSFPHRQWLGRNYGDSLLNTLNSGLRTWFRTPPTSPP